MAETVSPELVDSCALAPTVDPMEELAVDRTMMATGSGVKALPKRDDVDPTFSSRYQMSRTLGRGGMGFVDGVHDQRTDRLVALKRTRSLNEAAVARFLREARVQARLEHPAIVPVYDVGTDPQGNPFFTMRRLSGDTLSEIVKKLSQGDEDTNLRWTLHERLQRFVDICLALEYAHQQGVLHRDLKPSNMMLGALGEVYVLDWGLAKVIDEEESAPETGAPKVGLTSSGTVMGTPGYVAPEMLQGQESSRQSDVYALGAILHELLTLDRWHKGRSVSALVNSALESENATPRKRAPRLEIPPELDQACARATAADPRRRTQSPAALAAEIRAYLEGNRDEVRRQELARECVIDARQAAKKGDRKQAVAEAGRALALDPGNREAAALVASLLLEPPETLPEEVVEVLAESREETARLGSRRALRLYLSMLAFAPFMALLGFRDVPLAITLLVITLSSAAVSVAVSRRPASDRQALYWIECALNVLFLIGLSRMGGPFILIPVATLVVCTELSVQSHVSRSGLGIAFLMLAVILPFLLEEIGLLPQSMRVVEEGVLFIPRLVEVEGRAALWLLLGGILFVMLGFLKFIADLQQAKQEAQTRNALHAWHLRQLLPTDLVVTQTNDS